MSEDKKRLSSNPKPPALQKLAEHLSALGAEERKTLPAESDMLSLIVSGILNGEDLASRYPAFYRKLLENAGLRQAFLDALNSVQAERNGEMIPLPPAARASLDFLGKQRSPTPVLEMFEPQRWRAIWQRSMEQVRSIFAPSELAYRADALAEDPWFTLLRDELAVSGDTFAVTLECTLSNDTENALAALLRLAVTLGSTSKPTVFPLKASLQWGGYQESVLFLEEGRAKFPDIPLAAVLDEQEGNVQSGFRLSLESAA
jgi:hypothetical protein